MSGLMVTELQQGLPLSNITEAHRQCRMRMSEKSIAIKEENKTWLQNFPQWEKTRSVSESLCQHISSTENHNHLQKAPHLSLSSFILSSSWSLRMSDFCRCKAAFASFFSSFFFPNLDTEAVIQTERKASETMRKRERNVGKNIII